MVRVKICGVQSLEVAHWAVSAGADALGFIFVPGSRRYIDPQRARVISVQLPPSIRKVGVFADCPPEQVEEIARTAEIDIIQLHGQEDPRDYEYIGLPLIKAVRIDLEMLSVEGKALDKEREKCHSDKAIVRRHSEKETERSLLGKELERCRSAAVCGILLDSAYQGQFGGTGRSLPWQDERVAQVAEAIKRSGKTFILAGGLTPENVRQAIAELKPGAVDVSSGVEQAGIKRRELIEAFIDQVKGGGENVCLKS